MTDAEILALLREVRRTMQHAPTCDAMRARPLATPERLPCGCVFGRLDAAIAALEARALPLTHLRRYTCHHCGVSGSMVAYTDNGEPLCPACAPTWEDYEEWARADPG